MSLRNVRAFFCRFLWFFTNLVNIDCQNKKHRKLCTKVAKNYIIVG